MIQRAKDLRRARTYSGVRSMLIGFGIAAYTYLDIGLGASGGEVGAALRCVQAGIALQVLLIVVGLAIRRAMSDSPACDQCELIVELIADGLTVLLFALAVLGTLSQATSAF